jgi:hypothetical protein
MIRDMGRVVAQEIRIRQLCAQVVASKKPRASRPIFSKLKKLLHEHNKDLKRTITEYPIFLDDLGKRAA